MLKKYFKNIFSKKVNADADYKPYPYSVAKVREETTKIKDADLEESYKLYALRESSSGAFMHAVKQIKEEEKTQAEAKKLSTKKLNTK